MTRHPPRIPVVPVPDTMTRILDLERRRQALYDEPGAYGDEERRMALRAIESALADLWATRRQERAINRVRPRPQTRQQKRPRR